VAKFQTVTLNGARKYRRDMKNFPFLPILWLHLGKRYKSGTLVRVSHGVIYRMCH